MRNFRHSFASICISGIVIGFVGSGIAATFSSFGYTSIGNPTTLCFGILFLFSLVLLVTVASLLPKLQYESKLEQYSPGSITADAGRIVVSDGVRPSSVLIELPPVPPGNYSIDAKRRRSVEKSARVPDKLQVTQLRVFNGPVTKGGRKEVIQVSSDSHYLCILGISKSEIKTWPKRLFKSERAAWRIASPDKEGIGLIQDESGNAIGLLVDSGECSFDVVMIWSVDESFVEISIDIEKAQSE